MYVTEITCRHLFKFSLFLQLHNEADSASDDNMWY